MSVSVCIVCDPIVHTHKGDFSVIGRFLFSAKCVKPDALQS